MRYLKAALFCHFSHKKVACDDIENSTVCTNFPLMQMVSINSWNGTKIIIVYAKGKKKNKLNKIRVQNGSICYETRTSPHLILKYRPIKKKCNKLIKRQLLFKVQIALYRKKLRQFVPEANAQEKGLFKP